MPSYNVELTAEQNKDLLKYLTENNIEMSPEVFIQHLVAAMTDDCAMDEYELDDSDLDTASVMRHPVCTDKRHDDAMIAIYNSWKTTAGTEPLHSTSKNIGWR